MLAFFVSSGEFLGFLKLSQSLILFIQLFSTGCTTPGVVDNVFNYFMAH